MAPWLLLALAATALLGWWAAQLRAGFPTLLSLAPFAIPVLIAVRGLVHRSLVAPVLSGAVVGLSLSAATGRGALFLVLGLLAIYLEVRGARESARPGLATALALLGGIVLSMATAAVLAAVQT